ncbi:MAG: RluA family pseudouridine synthase [Planctomycetota bacterium]
MPGERPPDLALPVEELRTHVYPEIAGLRLDQALAFLLTWRTRSSIQRLIKEGRVLVRDGDSEVERVRPSTRVRAGTVLVVRIPKRERPAVALPCAELCIHHEDPLLLVVDKAPGMVVHPSAGRRGGTLINLLHARYRNLDEPAKDIVPKLCHRLDRETSGLILVAKDEQAHSFIRKQFEDHSVMKSYLAIVEGEMQLAEGWVDLPLGKARNSPIRVKVEPRRDGLPALTHYEVLERRRGMTLVECFPRTGRQHQLRVHLAAIGHPVVGDKLYGPEERYFLDDVKGCLGESSLERLRLPRHALHSHGLSFVHPGSGQRVRWSVPLADDMAALIGRERCCH